MKELIKLFKSFGYAFRGVGRTLAQERNMRIHVVCMTYMLCILGFSDWFTLSRTDWAVLLFCCGAVISGELFNTAIENAVDLSCEQLHPLAKKAKDAAAGAVLVSALFAVLAGVAVLFQPQAFRAMYEYFVHRPLFFALFVLSIVPATLFIFLGFGKRFSDD